MADEKKYDDEFGVDVPLSITHAQFANDTREEQKENGETATELVPEGAIELVDFKGREIRRICQNGEWLFSIVDVIGCHGVRSCE